MSVYCSVCDEIFNPNDYKFIYCIINTRNNRKNYFSDPPEFAFDYEYLKVELVRVSSDSDEYSVACNNSERIKCSIIIS
jgi:hypothetical protein